MNQTTTIDIDDRTTATMEYYHGTGTEDDPSTADLIQVAFHEGRINLQRVCRCLSADDLKVCPHNHEEYTWGDIEAVCMETIFDI